MSSNRHDFIQPVSGFAQTFGGKIEPMPAFDLGSNTETQPGVLCASLKSYNSNNEDELSQKNELELKHEDTNAYLIKERGALKFKSQIMESSDKLKADLQQELKLMDLINSGSYNEIQLLELVELIRVKDEIDWLNSYANKKRVIPLDHTR